MRAIMLLVMLAFYSCVEKSMHDNNVLLLLVRNVDIILGQSNANGHEYVIRLTGVFSSLKENIIVDNDTGFIKNYWAGDSFQIIKAGENTSEERMRFGIQPKLVSNLLRYYKGNVYFIQSAGSNYPIKHWHDGKPLTKYLVRSREEFKADSRQQSFRAKIRSVIFIHGEADTAICSTTHKSELQDLISRIRSRTNQPELIFVIVQALSNSKCAEGAGVLQLKQLEVSKVIDNALIPASRAVSLFDGCHYNIATYNRKADEIFQLIANHQ